jgi:hypothetical protein
MGEKCYLPGLTCQQINPIDKSGRRIRKASLKRTLFIILRGI